MAKKQEVDRFNMNANCRKCKSCNLNGGKCTGKTGIHPFNCLAFKENVK